MPKVEIPGKTFLPPLSVSPHDVLFFKKTLLILYRSSSTAY